MPGAGDDMDETAQQAVERMEEEMNRMRALLTQRFEAIGADRPVQLSAEQFAYLNRRTGRRDREEEDDGNDVMDVDYDPGVDPVWTIRNPLPHAANQKLHDNPPPTGARDIKGAKYPAPFTGQKSDARPFIRRLEAFWSLTPKASRLSRTRNLIACQLINTEPASSWASAVTESITLFKDDQYYYYDWDSFKEAFIKSFGVPNEQAYAMNTLTNRTQGYSEIIPFITDFERLQKEAGLSDDAALFFFKKNLNLRLFNEVSKVRPEPINLKDWKREAIACDRTHQTAQDFRYNQRNDRFSAKTSSKPFSSFTFRPTPTPHVPHGALLSSTQDPNAMMVDALSHKRKKGKGKDKKPPSKPKPVRAPLPAPKRPAPPPPYPGRAGQSKFVMADARCHRCGLKGHFMRDCVTKMNELSEEHIRQLAEFALQRDITEDELEEGSQQGSNDEEEDTEVDDNTTNAETETEIPSAETDFQKD